MRFANYNMFWLLLTVPVLVLFLVAAARGRRRALERFAAPPLAGRLAASVNRAVRTWKAVLVVAVLLFGLLALARPRWGFQWREVKHRGVDVFVLLDVSKSMLAEDVRPNRLAQARFAVKDLLHYLQGDRVGLIAFAGTAFVQCPLTVDREALRLTLNAVDPSLIPRGGSAIARAVETALKAFEAGESRDRVIILITDGEDTEGDPLAAAAAAAEAGVRIYAIGVGTVEGELIPVRESGQSMSFVKDAEGRVVKSRLNETVLRDMATKTGGLYVRSAPGDFGMETIYREGIARLQKDEYEARLQKRYFERYQWPLGFAVLLLGIEYFLSDRRRAGARAGVGGRSGRSDESEPARRGRGRGRVSGLMTVLLLSLPMTAAAGPARLYEEGKYQEALEAYRQAAEARPDDWALQYNRGAAGYKAGEYIDAAQAFERAMSAEDPALQMRALYNLGNARFRLGEHAEENQSTEDALALYRRSLEGYEQALELEPDEDARINRDIVKRKIEELEQQQEQQQQDQEQDQEKEEDQDEDQDQQENQQNQDQQDQQGDQDQEQEQDQQDQQGEQDQQQDQPPEPSQSDQQQDQQDQEQQQAEPSESSPEQKPVDYQRIQAEQLLDRLQETEQMWNYYPELEREAGRERVTGKDW